MGIFTSKKFHRTPEMPVNMQPIISTPSQKIEDNNLAKMRRQLYNDAPTFILNNLLLSVQFFNNYEKDIADLRISNVSRKQININTQLSEEQKHCLMPDTLHDLIDTNVCFQPKHGASKYYTETLHAQRILVAYDNIEVRNPSETAEYSSPLDGPIHKCVIEGTELKGYIQLKLEIKRKTNDQTDSSQSNDQKTKTVAFKFPNDEENGDILNKRELKKDEVNEDDNNNDENDEVFIQTNTNALSLPENKAGLIRQMSLTTQKMIIDSKSDKPQESEYTYNKITDHYTPKPLRQISTDATDNGGTPPNITTQLPKTCITSVEVKVFRNKIDEDVEKQKLREKYSNINDFRRHMMLRKKRELFKNIDYLNSIAFCDYFGDTFPRLGEMLGFKQRNIQLAMMQNAIIYIDVMDKETKHVTNYEVIPSLTSSWPDEAYEWSLRTRPIIQDERTQTAYCWPTPGMISRVKSLQNHIYPIGFYPKRGENPNRDLQWRLQFPAAERFLESHLHHAQIRCYLITLTFYKSFIEQKDTKLGLNADHIRTHLFWECERDYVRWPENRLGEKLKVFLKNLRRHLAYQDLPDYFIPSRNLFENIPTQKLLLAQRKIADILENPVMYTLRALRNLKYKKKPFYPLLNYNKLYSILTADNIIELINPQISVKLIENPEDKEEEDNSSDDESMDPMQRWYRDAYRERQKAKEIEKTKKERIRRISCDSISSEIKPMRTMDTMQQMLVLKLFIAHFIEMARASNTFDNPQQGLMYLQHAKNLNILLSEMTSGQEDGIEFSAHILQVEELLKISLAKEEVLPKIPARTIQKHNHHINRITKPVIIVDDPKVSTTSSDYVNVEQIITNEKLDTKIATENKTVKEVEKITMDDKKENMSNIKSVHRIVTNDRKNQINGFQGKENGENQSTEEVEYIRNEGKIEKVTLEIQNEEIKPVEKLKSTQINKPLLINEIFKDETGIIHNNKIFSNNTKDHNSENSIRVQVDVHPPLIFNNNTNHEIESRRKTVIQNQEDSTGSISSSKKELNENCLDDDIINDLHPKSNFNSNTVNETGIQENIILGQEYSNRLISSNKTRLDESGPDDDIKKKDSDLQTDVHLSSTKNIVNETKSTPHKIIVNEDYANRLTLDSKKLLNENCQNGVNSSSTLKNNPVGERISQKIILNPDYATCLSTKNWLNESCPDDEIIENDFDDKIVIRSGKHERPNTSSILLRENSDEAESTEL